MWSLRQIDALTETVAQRLLVDGEDEQVLATELCARLAAERADLPALALALPFSLAAGGLDEMLGDGEGAAAAAVRAWRMAALIGAEALALQALSGRPPTLADLDAHWRAAPPG